MKIVVIAFSITKWLHAAALGFMIGLTIADWLIGGDMWQAWLSLAGVNIGTLAVLYLCKHKAALEDVS